MVKKTHSTLIFLSEAIISDTIKRATKVIYYGNDSVWKNDIRNHYEPDLSVGECRDHRVTIRC